MKVIKKYRNRKLYDMDESRYITLNEIRDLVKHGEEIQIIDDSSGKDITSVVLTQILHSEEKRGGFIPQEGLKWILKHGGDALAEIISNIQNIKREAERHIKNIVKRGKEGAKSEEVISTISEIISPYIKNIEKFQQEMEKNVEGFLEKVKEFLPVWREDRKIFDEIKSIKKRISELERRIAKLEKNKVAS